VNPSTLSWQERNQWVVDLLVSRTGEGLETWNARIRQQTFRDEDDLRRWLAAHDVGGYPAMMLVMERFGYPDFLLATAGELVDAQYVDRPALRPIYEALMTQVGTLDPVIVQARKGYVSVLTKRRTFAAIEATTKRRVDLGLRLADQAPTGRLGSAASMGSGQVNVRIGLASVDDIDGEVVGLLRRAHAENR
jgi:predicted transport protein